LTDLGFWTIIEKINVLMIADIHNLRSQLGIAAVQAGIFLPSERLPGLKQRMKIKQGMPETQKGRCCYGDNQN